MTANRAESARCTLSDESEGRRKKWRQPSERELSEAKRALDFMTGAEQKEVACNLSVRSNRRSMTVTDD
jgi:hypothetical protein